MSVSTHLQNAMSDNLAFSLMARMHVILRRQNERVIDIEYMRINPGYCRYILDLALKLPNDDLHQICVKLEDIYFGEEGLFVSPPPTEPLIARLSDGLKVRGKLVTSAPVQSPAAVTDDEHAILPRLDQNSIVDQTYIGRLR
ncbi:hypothetical protein ACO0LB_12105 [Undibacterium sp. SXout7W]|uniref:hypothetical protein n=1 Tax=Undibacterium sp. SXout7W TaxID=3413049 RepID=UPI003BF13E52